MPRASTPATQSSRRSGRRATKRSRSIVEAEEAGVPEESGVAEIPTDDECADGSKNVPVDQAAMDTESAGLEAPPQETPNTAAADTTAGTIDDSTITDNSTSNGALDTMAVDSAALADGDKTALPVVSEGDADFAEAPATAAVACTAKGQASRSPSPAPEMKDVGSSDCESTLSPDPLPYGHAHIAACAQPGFKERVSKTLDRIMGNDSASIALGLKEPAAASEPAAHDGSAVTKEDDRDTAPPDV